MSVCGPESVVRAGGESGGRVLQQKMVQVVYHMVMQLVRMLSMVTVHHSQTNTRLLFFMIVEVLQVHL